MSKSVFIIRDQHERYLNTQDQWSGPESPEPPFSSPHRDIALNKLFEMTLSDVSLRGKVDTCPADERGKPLLATAATPMATANDAGEPAAETAIDTLGEA